MDISSITSAKASTNFLNPEPVPRSTGDKSLDVNDFLKLITVQLTSQDPMKPMEETQFISQMANFTSLEQMRTLSKNFESFSSEQRISSAQDYLGKIVSGSTPTGEVSGEVSSITLADGVPKISIGGTNYDPASVTKILPKPTPVSPSSL